MTVTCLPYELLLKYPFRISGFSRVSTPLMLLKVEYKGYVGLGEASMVPYMGESIKTAEVFLRKLDLSWLNYPFDYDEVIEYLDSLEAGNPAIKAAVDIALHDLQGKIEYEPCYKQMGARPGNMPVTSITIGMDKPELIIKKVEEAAQASVLKVKLGSAEDRILIETIRLATDKPLYVDANQGWTNKEQALEFIFWLKEQGVQLVEQPMPKLQHDLNAWITERSPLPIIADESVQRLADMHAIRGAYHGINVKLMKSAGMHEAKKMIILAKKLEMKVLIGCMSESSVATLAAAALAPLCDWADIDGPFLTSNNPFAMPGFKSGKWVLDESPGLGVTQNNLNYENI